MDIREQLTLCVPSAQAGVLEEARGLLDPVQATLIRAHVTLCREHELTSLNDETIAARLQARACGPLTLRFGAPVPFASHGLLLPCIGGLDEFQALRRCVLESDLGAEHPPHLTLAHPRNPKAPGNHPSNVARLRWPPVVEFRVVARIRQLDGGPWKSIGEHSLA